MTKNPIHRHSKLGFFLAEHRFRRLFLFAVENKVLLVRIRHEDIEGNARCLLGSHTNTSVRTRNRRSYLERKPRLLPSRDTQSPRCRTARKERARRGSLKSRAEIRRNGNDREVFDLRHRRRDRGEKKNDDEQEEVKPKRCLHLCEEGEAARGVSDHSINIKICDDKM